MPSRARRACVVAVVCILLASTSGGAADTGQVLQIVGVYPNPVTAGNVGEFVVLEATQPVDVSGWSLDDDSRTGTFHGRTIEGRVAASTAPAVTSLLTTLPVVPIEGAVRLAEDGDQVRLVDDAGTTVDTVSYPATAEGVLWTRHDDRMVPAGRFATDWSFPARGEAAATAFLLPDAPEVPVDLLANATDRIRLAGYELSDPRVVRALSDAVDAGIDVDVLVDGSPVAGQSAAEHAALDALAARGVDVRVAEGTRDPYRFHHPKYAVVDDAALVMTENWKPSGTGGGSSRGWGLRVDDERIARDLAAVFDGDFRGPAAISWPRYRHRTSPRSADAPTVRYPRQLEPMATTADAVGVSVAPETVAERKGAAIANATSSIRIQQVSIGGVDFPLLRAAVEAARRGVRVRVLLDSSWYVAPENEVIVDELARLADAEDVPLEARLVEPGTAFEKIHAKGLVVDDEVVFVGSANWNNNSMHWNREVVLEVRDPTVGAYFARAFDADWRDPRWTAPVGLALVAVAAWLTAGTFAVRRITFEP